MNGLNTTKNDLQSRAFPLHRSAKSGDIHIKLDLSRPFAVKLFIMCSALLRCRAEATICGRVVKVNDVDGLLFNTNDFEFPVELVLYSTNREEHSTKKFLSDMKEYIIKER